MSPVHNGSGAAGVKLCAGRLAATGIDCLQPVAAWMRLLCDACANALLAHQSIHAVQPDAVTAFQRFSVHASRSAVQDVGALTLLRSDYSISPRSQAAAAMPVDWACLMGQAGSPHD